MQKLPLAQQGDHSARQDPLNTDCHKLQIKEMQYKSSLLHNKVITGLDMIH